MNSRERVLTLSFAVVVLFAGLVFGAKLTLLDPLDQKRKTIASLEDDIDKKSVRLAQIEKERPKFERWKMLSLPPDPNMAARQYENYLTGIMLKSGFTAGSFSVVTKEMESKGGPTTGNKVPIYSRLNSTVTAHTNLANLVEMLKRFYTTGLLHQIKNISIQRPLTVTAGRESDLDINLTIEALSITGVDTRGMLVPNISRRLLWIDGAASLAGGPGLFALAPWAAGPTGPLGPGTLAVPPRDYDAIARINIFHPPQRQPDQDQAEIVKVTRFVYLNDITEEPRAEAFLFDRVNNKRVRLRPSIGFDSFKITDQDGEALVQGRVVKFAGTREMIVKVDNKYYAVHIGDNLEESLKTALPASRVKELGLTAPTEEKSARGRE